MRVGLYRRSRPVLASAAAAFFSVAAACGGGGGTTAGGNTGTDPFVAQAKTVADKATKRVTSWDGPTSGPKAQAGVPVPARLACRWNAGGMIFQQQRRESRAQARTGAGLAAAGPA